MQIPAEGRAGPIREIHVGYKETTAAALHPSISSIKALSRFLQGQPSTFEQAGANYLFEIQIDCPY
jgi:hypothetical protein